MVVDGAFVWEKKDTTGCDAVQWVISAGFAFL
jgi:hypothetical protein